MEGGCRECVNTNMDTDSTHLSPRTFRGCSHTTWQIIKSSPQERLAEVSSILGRSWGRAAWVLKAMKLPSLPITHGKLSTAGKAQQS